MYNTLPSTAALKIKLCCNYTQIARPNTAQSIGNKEMAAGFTFVAVSRLKSLKDGLFVPITYERFRSIGNLKKFKRHLTEEERLQQLDLSPSLCTTE